MTVRNCFPRSMPLSLISTTLFFVLALVACARGQGIPQEKHPAAGAAQTGGHDVFAEIGGRSIETRRGLLEEVRPPALPRTLLPTVFDADGWTPILTNGNGIWSSGAWKKMLAAAELPGGHGSYIVCQVELAGRIQHNPAAAIFARRLLTR